MLANSARGTATSASWEHHVATMVHDPDLHQLLAQRRQGQCEASSGKAKARMQLARLSARAWSWHRTALCRNAWQDNRVQRSASRSPVNPPPLSVNQEVIYNDHFTILSIIQEERSKL
jgi:hypothetical protein